MPDTPLKFTEAPIIIIRDEKIKVQQMIQLKGCD